MAEELQYTPVEEISEVVADARKSFRAYHTFPQEFRVKQLQNLHHLLTEREDDICDALMKDLRKSRHDVMGTEIIMVKSDIVNHIKNLDKWMKGEVPSVPLINKFDGCKIREDPLGVVLIIGAWNYPIQLTLMPMVGAISAGNCIVLKPSEVSPASAALLAKLIPDYLDPRCYKVINGAVDETTELLKQKFDKICYTGGGPVGKIVMKAAAEHLTPVLLELGGKSPCIVDDDVDMQVAAQRIIWGRCLNSGQTCISPDYVLCQPETQPKLLEAIGKAIVKFYGENPIKSDALSRIVNHRHYKRLKLLLDCGEIALGGRCDEEECFIEPTVMINCDPGSKLITDEIFGPILPIVNISSIDEAIEYVNDRDKPLALYVFSNNKAVCEKVLRQTTSGAGLANDTVMHSSVPTLPFGGVGPSGTGSYHGKFSFDAFSHKKASMSKTLGLEFLNDVRYPPYTEKKLNILKRLMDKKLDSGGISWLTFGALGMALAGGAYYIISQPNIIRERLFGY